MLLRNMQESGCTMVEDAWRMLIDDVEEGMQI